MTRRSPVLLAVACALLGSCFSEPDRVGVDYRVQTIGCLLPIPGRYVLNTDADGGYLFYDSSETSFGLIRIEQYDKAELDDLLSQSQITSKFETANYVAIGVLWKLEDSTGPQLPATIIHDHEEVVTIIGDEATSWKSRFDACLRMPQPQKPNNLQQVSFP